MCWPSCCRRYPGVRLTISEQSRLDVEQRFSAEGVVVAVLPTLDHPLAPGMQEKLLWREPLRVVVHPGHAFAVRRRAVTPAELVTHPLVLRGSFGDSEPEVLTLLAERGLAVRPRATVDTPQSLVAMARAGVGVGVPTPSPWSTPTPPASRCVDIDDPDMVREVAAYWYEVLVEHAGRHGAAPRRAGRAGAARCDRSPPGGTGPRTRVAHGPRGGRVGSPATSGSAPGGRPRAERRIYGPVRRPAGGAGASCGRGWPRAGRASRRSCRSRVLPGSARPR